MPPTPSAGQIGNPMMFNNQAQVEGQPMGLYMENEDGEQMNVEGRDLDTFLLDQKRYEEERK